MKKIISLILCLTAICLCTIALADLEINGENFPDASFRRYLKDTFRLTERDYLTDYEINIVKSITCTNYSITSLKGIEYFPNLTHLYCQGNRLTSLDLSGNPGLIWLDCSDIIKLKTSENDFRGFIMREISDLYLNLNFYIPATVQCCEIIIQCLGASYLDYGVIFSEKKLS